MGKAKSRITFTILFTLVFLCLLFIIPDSGKAQDNLYLESNYQLAWGGSVVSMTQSSPDGKLVYKFCHWSGKKGVHYPTSIFDARTFRLMKQIYSAEEGVDRMKVSEDGKRIFFLGITEKTIEVWDVETETMIRKIETPFVCYNIDVSHDGSRVLYFAKNGNLVDVNSGKILFVIENVGYGNMRFINNDENILAVCKEGLIVVDAKSGVVTSTMKIPDGDRVSAFGPFVVDKSKKFFLLRGWNRKIGGFSYYGTVGSGQIKIINTIDDGTKIISNVTFSDDLHFLYGISDNYSRMSNSLYKYDLNNGKIVNETEIVPMDNRVGMIFAKSPKTLIDLVNIKNGEYLLITDNYNVSYFYSVKEDKVKAWLYSFGFDYAFVTPDGRMDGTRGAIEKLQWVKGDQKIPLSATYDQMFTPNLMAQIFEDKLENSSVSLSDIVKFTPEIKITNPKPESKTSTPTLSITCELKENGDEITQVRIFVNDKLVSDETRGMKAAGNTATYNVTLLPGVNSVQAVAVTKNGYQSGAAEVMVTFSGTAAESRLYVMAIGIDKYKNPAYNLNYAVADASAIVDMINSSAREIFKSVNVYTYQNEKANRTSILAGFDEIASQAQPQDAFILFYAGHGVMSEGSPEVPKDFYLVLQSITQAYGKDDLLKSQGISAAELREFSKKITAQKQVVFLDACQSGAAVETFAMRGMAEEKAILQLARSTGSYLIASTGSEQFATEFKELGHGIFTYAILQGMNCHADGSEKDNKVTIKELEAYLNDNLPTLTEKYHGTVQYPKSWSKGMDFPITVCK
jgi:WD40 repeat protein